MLAAAACVLSSCGHSASKDFDLILVSVDTLRADHLGIYGASRQPDGLASDPFSLAWLAEQGLVWDSAWAPAGKTLPSLGTFWSGQFPLEHGGLSNKHSVRAPLESERLNQAGWKTAARVANRSLYPPNGLARGFETYEVLWGEQEKEIGPSLLQATRPWVQQQKRFVIWGHWMAPHQPYGPPPPYDRQYTWGGPKGENQLLADLHRNPARATPELREHLLGLYDGEVAWSADAIQSFLKGLDAQYQASGRGSLLENARVVFFSDHGEELGDRFGYFMHAKSLYSGVIQVPMVMAGVGIPSRTRSDTLMSLADALPFLLRDELPDQDFVFSAWQGEFFSARNAEWTLIHNPCQNEHGPNEKPHDTPYVYPALALYYRATDPLEKKNVAQEHPEVVRAMLGALHTWYGELNLAPPGIPPGIDPSILEQLGYTSGFENNPCEPWSAEDIP